MSYHWDNLRSTMGLSMLVSFYGIVSLLVWIVGPSLGLGGETERVIIIALILLTWPIAILVGSYRKRRAARQSVATASIDAQSASQVAGPQPAGRTYDDLARGAEETVRWLRGSKLGAPRLGDAVYRLPWYIVAGPQASGKTSLLLSSNLDFHAMGGQRQGDQKVVYPTRDCEWRISDWAVLIDTAGRYQTDGPDGEEWAALIETLKKYRKARPIDGMVVAVDASRTLAANELAIEQQAKVLRARIDDVIARTQLKFPLYLVFTHMESVEGFEEFFSALEPEERGQVWGATIPLERSANAHALFDVEFDILLDSLLERRLSRLSSVNWPAEQLRIFDFPLGFAEARRKFGLLASILCRPNPFSESPLLRGFYFSSSTADFSPPGEFHVGSDFAVDEDEFPAGTRVVGDGYFAEALFKDVLLRDKDLAAFFQTSKRRPERIRNVVLGASAALILLIFVWLVVGYVHARTLVRDARALSANVTRYSQADSARDVSKQDAQLTPAELTSLEALRQKLDEIDEYGGPASWLFSVDSVKPYARAAYFDAINYRFFKPVVAEIESDLQTFSAGGASSSNRPAAAVSDSEHAASDSDEGRYYDLLKAYLMLANPQRTEATFLDAQLQPYWRKLTPQGGDENAALKQLEFYARQAREAESPHIKAAEKIVGDAQQRLRTYPVVERVYKNITTEVDLKVPRMTLESILQRSGAVRLESAVKVPGSFTLKGYHEYMSRIDSAASKVDEDAWVMGPYSKELTWQVSDSSKLRDRYLSDYAEHWKSFLRSITVARYNNLKDAEDTLSTMMATDSPVIAVAREAAKQTSLGKASAGGFFSWIGSLFSSNKGKADAGNRVDAEFGPLPQFLENESAYREGLKRLYDKIYSRDTEQLKQDAKSVTETTQSVAKQLEPLNTKLGSQAAAVLLKQPLERLSELLTLTDYQDVKRTWQDRLSREAQELEARFPFSDSGQDVPLGDLAAFLNPVDGHLSTFVKSELGGSFDSQWKLKENSPIKDRFSDDFKNYLRDAYRLREALFGSGNQIDVSYEIVLQSVAGADVSIEIDGQTVSAPGTGSATFKWSNNAGASGAKVTVNKGTQQQTLQRPGKWGVFRLFREGGLARGDGPYRLGWNVGGVRVEATVKPARSPNPFAIDLFTALSRVPKSPGS